MGTLYVDSHVKLAYYLYLFIIGPSSLSRTFKALPGFLLILFSVWDHLTEPRTLRGEWYLRNYLIPRVVQCRKPPVHPRRTAAEPSRSWCEYGLLYFQSYFSGRGLMTF